MRIFEDSHSKALLFLEEQSSWLELLLQVSLWKHETPLA